MRRVHFSDGWEWQYRLAGDETSGTVTILAPKGHPRFNSNQRWKVPFSELDPDTQEALVTEEREYQEARAQGEEWWPDTGCGGCPWIITPSIVKAYIQREILTQSAAKAT